MSDLRWHPQPGAERHSSGYNHAMPIVDGWREMGGNRRWRVRWDDRALYVNAFRPRSVAAFNTATDE